MPATIDFEASRDLAAAPEDVFDYVSDPLNDPAWCPMVNGCTQLKGNGPGAGAVYVWDQIVGEDQAVPMEVTIDVFDRPTRLGWSVDNDMMGYTASITFEGLDTGGTRITQHNRTIVKMAPDDMSKTLKDQAVAVNQQQMDNLEKMFG